MRHWLAFLALFIATPLQELEAQPFAHNIGGQPRKKANNIRNKNVNIIVNMDPKQIASELWNVIKEHLGTASAKDAAVTMREIESVITPVVNPSRRGGVIPVTQIADDLETITRRLIINENPSIDPMKLETITKEVSSDLMASLQSFWYGVNIDDKESKRKKSIDSQNNNVVTSHQKHVEQ
ncbi:PREDICTED: uncharacterized protein LOC105361476 isoform X2 [Ceratosolen solmsi marchali]|uniref:Uncharacterized protein LOC105361476 isoform X2 n=1 Tax=Ceratosolen solmsi marchali TaxID=326594 RepID=A0AAJ6YF87_9HYME|nr:PREDICTED: uncharacterized protein LOC105361476 isoform X2 [Ceratosolen solmsi marchali]